MSGSTTAAVVLAGLSSVAAFAWAVTPGPNKIKFPEGYEKGVLYGTVDRYDTKQYREFYASPAVIQAAREGKPLPHGAVLTMVISKARVDAAGAPVKDANGRFIKDGVIGITVMEKQKGWGADIPEALRNGEWEYQAFLPDGKVNDKANLDACYACHKPFERMDYVTNLSKLAGAFPSGAQVTARSGTNDVTITGFTFGPNKVVVPAGGNIAWTNGDDSPHQISVQGSNVRSDVLLKGQTVSLRFADPGNFTYVCGLHPGMKGTIEVTR